MDPRRSHRTILFVYFNAHPPLKIPAACREGKLFDRDEILVIPRDATGSTRQGRGAVTLIDYIYLVIDLSHHVLRETLGEAL